MNLHLQTKQFVLGSEEAIVARDDSWCRQVIMENQKREARFIERDFAGERDGNKIKYNLDSTQKPSVCQGH